jgi:NitT/TauT family transport system ATP-binding protein
MSVSDLLELPSYLDHSPKVSARLRELRERPKVLEIDSVCRIFQSPKGPVVALQDVSFDVVRREFVSVIGPSGCGKSTLNRILAGLDSTTSGEIRLDGRATSQPGADRGMVFQSYTLFPWLSVQRNVMFGLRMKGMKKSEALNQAGRWLEVVGLSAFADHYPAQLSGGMKQRVAIARALANEPRILLMDEPFGALDAQTRASMQEHLLRIWRKEDVTILFVTHDLDEAVLLSDRIVVLGSQPGHIQEIIEVPVERPRSAEQTLSGHFLATKKRLEELIHGNPKAGSKSGDQGPSDVV